MWVITLLLDDWRISLVVRLNTIRPTHPSRLFHSQRRRLASPAALMLPMVADQSRSKRPSPPLLRIRNSQTGGEAEYWPMIPALRGECELELHIYRKKGRSCVHKYVMLYAWSNILSLPSKSIHIGKHYVCIWMCAVTMRVSMRDVMHSAIRWKEAYTHLQSI